MTTYTHETLRKACRIGVAIPIGDEVYVTWTDFCELQQLGAAHADAWQARETELVEALKQLMDYCDSTTKPEWVRDEAYAKARAAIKKAEPTQQPYDDSLDFPMPDISDGDPMNDPSVR